MICGLFSSMEVQAMWRCLGGSVPAEGPCLFIKDFFQENDVVPSFEPSCVLPLQWMERFPTSLLETSHQALLKEPAPSPFCFLGQGLKPLVG